MKDYFVRLPMAGIASVQVEADSEEEAIEKAMLSEITIDNFEEWDVFGSICTGNVCHAPLFDAYAEEE